MLPIVVDRKKFEKNIALIKKVAARRETDIDLIWVDINDTEIVMSSYNGLEYISTKWIDDSLKQVHDSFAFDAPTVLNFVKSFKSDILLINHNKNEEEIIISLPDNTGSCSFPCQYISSKKISESFYGYAKLEINSDSLYTALSMIKFSVDPNKSHAPICGVKAIINNDQAQFYSSDMSRISRFSCNLLIDKYDEDIDICFPQSSLSILDFVYDIKPLYMHPNDKYIILSSSSFTYIVRKEAGGDEYPDFSSWMDPHYVIKVNVQKDDILNKVKSVVSGDRINAEVSFNVEDGICLINIKDISNQNRFLYKIKSNQVYVNEMSECIAHTDMERFVKAIHNIREKTFDLSVVVPNSIQTHMLFIQSDNFSHLIFPPKIE